MASFVAHHHVSLLEREGMMSSALALRSSLRPCEAVAEEVAAAGPAAACGGGADRGGVAVFADEFSVEDLLDLEDLCEVDKDCGAELGDAAPGAVEEEDKLSSDSHGSSSVVSYELMTLPVPHQMIDLPLPAHDAEELEWVSRIMDDSLAELPPPPKLPAAPFGAARRPLQGTAAGPAMRRSPTPTICALSTEALVPVKAKRGKRARASVWSLSPPLSESTTTSSSSTTTTSSCTSSSASFSPLLLLPAADSSSLFLSSSHLLLDETTPRPPKNKSKHGKHGSKSGGKPKKRGRKPKKHHPRPPQFAGGSGAGAGSAPAAQQGDRRCSHCGVQKTPQWRAGPEGAKTLCNACGVRYKSGRLLPEYRPACSPTFVSSIHSNSHRKVLEMRRMKEDVHGPLPLPPVPTAALLGLGPAVASF